MKKVEIEKIKDELSRKRTKTLEDYIKSFESIIYDRKQTKAMYFWCNNGDAAYRRYKENRYARNLCIGIGDHKLQYYRKVEMTRAHVYTKEALYFDDVKCTSGDLKKLGIAFQEIVDRRSARA